ncbi:MAG: glycosyltransferase family protein [bacterium]
MTIASYLAEHLVDCSILVLTDLSIIGRFKFPQNVDYVHLPGIVGKSNLLQHANRLNLEPGDTLTIRRKIIKGAAKTFQPDFFIVEHEPFRLQDEMHNILSFVRDQLPKARLIWGLSDVLGDPEMICRDWNREGFYRVLEQYCDEVWVYGAQEIFDHVSNYKIPVAVASNYYYTGYLRPPRTTSNGVHKDIARLNHNKKPYVLLMTGSGTEGFTLIDNYLRALERLGEAAQFQSLIVTGPMMQTRDKLLFKERAHKLPGVIFHRFSKNVLQYVKHARMVVCNGGYNALCEILSYRKHAIFAPPLAPPNEHLLRAEIFQNLGVIKRLHPRELSAEHLSEMIQSDLFGSPALAPPPVGVQIPFNGLDKIVERIEVLGGANFRALRQAV